MEKLKSDKVPIPLQTRTKTFAIYTFKFCKQIGISPLNEHMIKQLLRSSSSVGANYFEASETDTKKDFSNKIRIARKEAKESMYWTDLLIETLPQQYSKDLMYIRDEAMQLVKILAAIYEKTK
jgi:four helix bundle protein